MAKVYSIRAQRMTPQGKLVGPVLRFDGKNFSDNRPAKVFADQLEAVRLGREMLKRFAILDQYRVTVDTGIGHVTATKKNPKRRAKGKRKRNPATPAHSAALQQARDKFRDFTGHTPKVVSRVNKRATKVALEIGDLDFVGYTTTRDGKREKYIHKFRKASKPRLAASHDGKQLEIVGGQYEFTEAGIEDR